MVNSRTLIDLEQPKLEMKEMKSLTIALLAGGIGVLLSAPAMSAPATAQPLATAATLKSAQVCAPNKVWSKQYFSQGPIPTPGSTPGNNNSYNNFAHVVRVNFCTSNSTIRLATTGVSSNAVPTDWMMAVYAIRQMSNTALAPASPSDLFKPLIWTSAGTMPAGSLNKFTIVGTALNPVVKFYKGFQRPGIGSDARVRSVIQRAVLDAYTNGSTYPATIQVLDNTGTQI